jgi:hypothetical protein
MSRRYLIAALTLLGFIAAPGPLSAQTAPLAPALAAAEVQLIEIRDDSGRAVLRGQFTDVDGERFAALGPATVLDMQAAGDAEIDGSEVEVSVRNVAPRSRYTLVLDGAERGTFTTDGKGRGRFTSGP